MDKYARPKLTHGFAQALFDNRYMIRAQYILMQIDILFEQIKGALKR